MSVEGKNCWSCGTAVNDLEYGRGDVCRSCRRDTRVCKNCIFYDVSFNNSCKENQADRVVEKEKSNFCDYFLPGKSASSGAKSPDALKAAADALFKKKGDK